MSNRGLMMFRIVMAALLASVTVSHGTGAQSTYPTRTATIVVPFGAGSGTDVMARTLPTNSARRSVRPVVVENRPGGASIFRQPSMSRVQRRMATPCSWVATQRIRPIRICSRELRYDPVKDFTPISRLATAGAVLVVAPKERYQDAG